MKHQPYLLFPSVITVSDYIDTITNEQIHTIKNLEVQQNAGNDRSKDVYLLDKSVFKSLKTTFEEALNNYLREILQIEPEVEIYITQSWANFTGKNQFHHLHNHANSFLSGVFYVDVNEEDSIYFYSPIKDQYMIKVKSKNSNFYNASCWSVPIKTGQLLIFPSTLDHEVVPKTENNNRISISFNTFLKGIVGDTERLTELKL
jgi:uncharacterized protein (TIGR02466 family)